MKMIDVNGLTKRFGQFTAVDHVSFDIKRGVPLTSSGVKYLASLALMEQVKPLPCVCSAPCCDRQRAALKWQASIS